MATYDSYQKTVDLIHLLIETVAFNGNLLLNVGPRADGTLPPIFEDRLIGIGEWLTVNGEAIYESKPWTVCSKEASADVFYTTKNQTLYAILRQWPEDNTLTLSCPQATKETKARMLGVTNEIRWNEASPRIADWRSSSLPRKERNLWEKGNTRGLELSLPPLNPATTPCLHAWVVALTGIANI